MFLLGNVLGNAALLYLSTVFLKLRQPVLESFACTIDGPEIAKVAVQDQRLPCSQIVEEPSPAHDLAQLLVGQALVEHRQVIAEIEEGLAWISLWQRSSA